MEPTSARWRANRTTWAIASRVVSERCLAHRRGCARASADLQPALRLGRLIGRHWKGWLDIYIADEVHDYKGRTTAIGAAFGAMVSAARYTVGLTGTLFGGTPGPSTACFCAWATFRCCRYGWRREAFCA